MQTEKLTLAQLSGYLAYGLQVHYFDDERGAKRTCNIELLHVPDEVTIIDGMYQYDVSLSDIQPLVIPLDRLTEAQWIEVFKAGTGHDIEVLNIDPTSVHGFFNATMYCHYYFNDFEFRSTQTFNQMAAFNKLHELHADLHGWIEKGLGINKLDYEK